MPMRDQSDPNARVFRVDSLGRLVLVQPVLEALRREDELKALEHLLVGHEVELPILSAVFSQCDAKVALHLAESASLRRVNRCSSDL